jgi:hypothetical protein
MPALMKKAFKKGLIKAAKSTESWIITNGLNSGAILSYSKEFIKLNYKFI